VKCKWCGFEVVIHPVSILYFVCLAFFSSWIDVCCMAAALLVHEMGHLIMATMVGEKVRSIHLAPYGGIIQFKSISLKGVRGMLFAAGGPLANLITLILLRNGSVSGFLITEAGRKFAYANMIMLAFNSMPAFPLDGGQILFSIGYYFCPISWLVTALSALGMVMGISMASFAFYGLMSIGKLNCTLLIAGVYLIIEARRERIRMLRENAYTVFQERNYQTEQIRTIRAYRVSPETKVLQLFHKMTGVYESIFLVRFNKAEYILYEDEVYNMILNRPDECVEAAIADKLYS